MQTNDAQKNTKRFFYSRKTKYRIERNAHPTYYLHSHSYP